MGFGLPLKGMNPNKDTIHKDQQRISYFGSTFISPQRFLLCIRTLHSFQEKNGDKSKFKLNQGLYYYFLLLI
jgi:hypothetical protein